jgi:hypothetical protein
VIRRGLSGREPPGSVWMPLYREVIEVGTVVHDIDGNRWRFIPRWHRDPTPWVLCAEDT